jgi:quercetin dioxygenase-like cupin family protein
MRVLAVALLLIAQGAAAAAPIPIRSPLGSFAIEPEKAVTHVEAMRVDFLPAQEMPEHMHPVPVVCFVARGRFAVSIGDAAVRTVRKGDATLERAGEIVHYFRNLSKTRSAQLYCTILAGAADKQYTVMLNK